MASRNPISRSFNLIAGMTLIGISIAGFSVHHFTCSVANVVADLALRAIWQVPSVALGAWQVARGHAIDLHLSGCCPGDLILSTWPAICFLTGAA